MGNPFLAWRGAASCVHEDGVEGGQQQQGHHDIEGPDRRPGGQDRPQRRTEQGPGGQDNAPKARLIATWIAMFQGKEAIAA